MTIQLTWEEFIQLGWEKVGEKFSNSLHPPQFKKDYGRGEGIGKAYDLPDFVEFEVAE